MEYDFLEGLKLLHDFTDEMLENFILSLFFLRRKKNGIHNSWYVKWNTLKVPITTKYSKRIFFILFFYKKFNHSVFIYVKQHNCNLVSKVALEHGMSFNNQQKRIPR